MNIADEKRIIKSIHSDWVYYKVQTGSNIPIVGTGVDIDIAYHTEPITTDDEFRQLELLIDQLEPKIHESTVNKPVHLYINNTTINEVSLLTSFYNMYRYFNPCMEIIISDPMRWMQEMACLNNIPLPNLRLWPDLPDANDTLNFIQERN